MSLTCVVVVSAGGWLWFMEFGLTCGCSTRCAWLCEVVITGDSGGQVKLILNIDWSLWWLVDWWFWLWLMGSLVGCDDEWWMMIRCFEIDDWCFGCGLLVTCYLLLMFFVFVWLSNCRVVWGLDHKAGAGRVVGYWLLMVLVGDWRESCFFWRSGWFVDELLFGWSDGLNRGWGWSVVVSWGKRFESFVNQEWRES